MATLPQIATEVSRLINDSYDGDPSYNFTRWTETDLIHYAEDAINMLFLLHPKKFTTAKDMQLELGSVQTLPDGCSTLAKVLGVKDDSGAISSVAAEGDDRLSALFTNGCASSVGSDYEIDGYSLEAASDRIFYVQPPVESHHLPVTLTVLCAGMPDVEEGYEPPAWMHNLIVEWMQYRAYSSEEESTNSEATATLHLQNFYAIIANYKQAEDALTGGRINPVRVSAANETS